MRNENEKHPEPEPSNSSAEGAEHAAHDEPSDAELRETLRRKGWVEAKALVEPGAGISPQSNRGPRRSVEAQRKAEERERDLAAGWRQHNVKAPDDADARELLSSVAQALKSQKLRKAIRLTLADPDLITIGRRVRRLKGEAGARVRDLLKQ